MITQSRELSPRSRSGSRPIMDRCQTSGNLKGSKYNQSQRLPMLMSGGDVIDADVTSPPVSPVKDRLHVSFMPQRAKSTSDLVDSTSKGNSAYSLPSIQRSQKQHAAISCQPDVIEEEDEQTDVASTVMSVHTTTDHVGISTIRRAQKNDIASLKKNPSRIFPKMMVLLNSYDSDRQGTFHEIMELGDDADGNTTKNTTGRFKTNTGSLNQRYISKSARVNGSTHGIEKPQIKMTVKSARKGTVAARKDISRPSSKDHTDGSGINQKLDILPAVATNLQKDLNQTLRMSIQSQEMDKTSALDSQSSHTNSPRKYQSEPGTPCSGHKRRQNSQGGTMSRSSTGRHSQKPQSHSCRAQKMEAAGSKSEKSSQKIGDSQTSVELSETQRYVKMIQQLTAYLPEHLLATAEEQIRKMSNTDQIMKFKRKMIEKNHALIDLDTMVDPRWRRLEGTLVNDKKNGRWCKNYQAWVLKQ